MYYQIYTMAGKTRFFTEVRSFSKIPYITAGEMKKRYPDKNFVIIGEIGSLGSTTENGDWLYLENGEVIPILPRGSLKIPFEWVVGYTAVQENSYVAVIGGILHLFVLMVSVIKRIIGIKRKK